MTVSFEKTLSEALSKIINDSMIAKSKAEKPRTYLGASRWGLECERQLYYEYVNAEKDSYFSGEILRIFDMGHDSEERVASYIKNAGFDLHVSRKDGSQFGFKAIDGKLEGHIDGVILSGNLEGIQWPALWENKALNDKSWKDLQKKGLKESKPIYYAQANIYMAFMELSTCLFTALNRNTGEIYAQVVPFDASNAQICSDRATRVVSAPCAEELPRIARDQTDYKCRWCDFAKKCWEEKQKSDSLQTPKPTWL